MFLSKIFGDPKAVLTSEMKKIAQKTGDFEPAISSLSDSDLSLKTTEFKKRLEEGETLDDILPEAFAVVREAAKRLLGQRHFDVQLMGGYVLSKGNIAEMRTGEGKTLVGTLPVYLNALSGKGVHVVTVNDYLARRDAVWMGQIYAFLGLSVGVINNQASYLYDKNFKDDKKDQVRDDLGSFKVVHEFLRPSTRAESYAADITYGTNNEFGFDYLRDNLARDTRNVVGRRDPKTGKAHFALIDEVDSILIDEARTPLIISMPFAESGELYKTFAKIAANLHEGADYEVDEKLKAITLSDDGITKAEKALNVDNIYTDKGIKYVHHLENAVKAKALYQKDKEYVVKDDEVVIVDEFTGRLQPGRRWSEGLHQAIEAKEGLKVQDESKTIATVTIQNYFRLYDKLAGMTGTAVTSEEEFGKVYGLLVVPIPTNNPIARIDREDLVYQSEAGKWQALTKKVKELQEKGQPVLVGTVSIEKNELVSAYFKRAGIRHEVLNAKNHQREGEIVAEAGKRGSVVIATNMAGRGVDIKLGGPMATEEEARTVKELGGLYVLGTERHEARRIDNQLRGRAGRQGDPGETQFYLSLEDTLMRVFGTDRIKGMMGKFGIPEDEPLQNKLVSRSIESAQKKIEGLNFDLRKHLLEYDDVTNKQRISVYDKRRRFLYSEPASIKDWFTEASVLLGEDIEKISAELEEKWQTLGPERFADSAKRGLLQTIDLLWMEHLEALDYMRGSVRLRAYGQRDPLVEFKKEALRLYHEFEFNLADMSIKLLPNIGAEFREEAVSMQTVHETGSGLNTKGGMEKSSTNSSVLGAPAQAVPSSAEKPYAGTGRNDSCPCGSGKKYKKCHGA